MSLAWYFNRLRAMSPAEIMHRVGERAKKSAARDRMEGWDRYRSEGGPPQLAGLLDNLAAAPDHLKSEISAASRFILSGRFEALGVSWPIRDGAALFPTDVWRLDPVTGGSWPGSETYCFDIPYRHERTLGDVKYVWEFNRLQFLQPLAADAALTGNVRAVKAIEDAVESWYAANPPFRGLGWNSGIELGLRSISLLVVTSLCGTLLSSGTIDRIRAILNAHMVWMARYPSRFSSANNHLVAEVAGEFLIAQAMPELPLAAKLDAKGRRILAVEATKQILPDGVGAEQSPTYGAFTAEFILLCSMVARAVGKPLAAGIDARLRAFADHIAWLSNSEGRVPGICDDDEGRVLTLSRHEPAYAASVCAGIAGYLGEAPAGPRPPEVDLRDALFRSPLAGTPAPQGFKTFADGGYTVIRETKLGLALDIVVDHAPLGYLSIAAHGHADALSVILAIDGEPVLVDPGTYLYHSGGVWRDWFRGTRAHNTLNIDGADQSTMSGAFNWAHKAIATLEAVDPKENWSVTASHNGYERRFGVSHRRTVSSTHTGLAIHDTLLSASDAKAAGRTAEIVYQLAPDCDAVANGMDVAISRNGSLLVTLSFSDQGDLEIKAGGELGDGGWYSPAFGKKIAASRISWRGAMSENGIVSTFVLAERR